VYLLLYFLFLGALIPKTLAVKLRVNLPPTFLPFILLLQLYPPPPPPKGKMPHIASGGIGGLAGGSLGGAGGATSVLTPKISVCSLVITSVVTSVVTLVSVNISVTVVGLVLVRPVPVLNPMVLIPLLWVNKSPIFGGLNISLGIEPVILGSVVGRVGRVGVIGLNLLTVYPSLARLLLIRLAYHTQKLELFFYLVI